MTIQFSVTVRDNEVAQFISVLGSAATLKIFSGAQPPACSSSDPSGLLVTISLPATPLTHSAGVTAISGTWSGTASATGTAACFRMYDGSSVCHMQGNVTSDLFLNNTSIASGQTVAVTAFTLTRGNA